LTYVRRALELIPVGSRVLELGCGAGVPLTVALAEGRDVTGVDISRTQIEMARRNVPSATFLNADMTAVSFPPESFDAVVAFYSLTHVPRDDVAPLLGRIRGWLRPGGVVVLTMGADDDPGGIEEDWLGVDMYFSHFNARKNRRLVAEAGFIVDSAEVLVEPEDRFDARFLWVVAHAP
jgi:cyclopropane fatty-acyl-phospholipid synthase-like methyltransferase